MEMSIWHIDHRVLCIYQFSFSKNIWHFFLVCYHSNSDLDLDFLDLDFVLVALNYTHQDSQD